MPASRAVPAFRRLDVDERRRQMLEAGARLFTERGYDGVAMSDVAREAGVSKGLLYHYFASKPDFFAATLEAAAGELAEVTRTDPSLPPLEQLSGAVDAYLAWIEAHSDSYRMLMGSAGSHAEVAALIDRVRAQTAQRIVDGLAAGGPPPLALPIAVHGWLWFMDGACLRWLEGRDLDRDALRDLLVQTLAAAVAAAS